MRLIDDLSLVSAPDWNRLAGDGPGAIFVRHEWLHALETSGCVGEKTGWQPLHLLLEDADKQLVGAVPMYAKYHSYGEYVFDWAWADAYQRHGLEYYPKLLSAVPFTPIAGNRLMASDDAARAALAQGLRIQAQRAQVSSLHVLFPDAQARQALSDAGYMMRTGVQFHWNNQNYKNFDEFLSSLTQKKRKKIRAERRKVNEAGVQCKRLVGDQITAQDWEFFIRCYNQTYREHHSTPYLNLDFFQTLAVQLPQAFIMIRAEYQGEPVAASLLVRDSDRIFGRYWGALARVSNLHFEVAYYQTIEAAIDLKIQVIEGGAQGEHKMARGFMPVQTCSAHWLAQDEFSDAVQNFLDRETNMLDGYFDELSERAVFTNKPENSD